jgi:hypothetical protein
VQRLTVLVTSDGKRLLPEGDEFFATLARLAPGGDAIGFAVTSLGFIKFQVLDGVTVVELHPRTVGPQALTAVERRIAELGDGVYQIRYLDTDWLSETAFTAEAAIERLREIAEPAAPETASAERFMVEPQDYGRLLCRTDNPLRVLSQKWCASFGEFDERILDFAEERGFSQRMMLATVARQRPDPAFRYIGGGFAWLEPDFPGRCVGQPLDSLPDKQYAAWLSGFYKSVALRGEPRYDRVVAQIRTAAGDYFAAHYERLLLPWRAPSGDMVVSLLAQRIAA